MPRWIFLELITRVRPYVFHPSYKARIIQLSILWLPAHPKYPPSDTLSIDLPAYILNSIHNHSRSFRD